jgi:hypothetical protein
MASGHSKEVMGAPLSIKDLNQDFVCLVKIYLSKFSPARTTKVGVLGYSVRLAFCPFTNKSTANATSKAGRSGIIFPM